MLLLDEPTAGLPAEMRDRVMQLIRQKATEENVSVVIVEHDLNVIWSFSDYVHFMAEGSVVLQGRPGLDPGARDRGGEVPGQGPCWTLRASAAATTG